MCEQRAARNLFVGSVLEWTVSQSVVAQAAGIRQCDMVCDANCGSQIFVSASVGCLKENGQHGRPATQLHIPPVLRRPILTERSLLPKLWLCITAHAFASVCCHCSVHGCSSYGCSVGVCIGHARLDLLKYRHQLCMQNSNTTCMHSIAVSKQFRGAAQRLRSRFSGFQTNTQASSSETINPRQSDGTGTWASIILYSSLAT